MKDKKSAKLNPQHKQDQNGHLSPSTFAKLLDPEASWDKDRSLFRRRIKVKDFLQRLLDCLIRKLLGTRYLFWLDLLLPLRC
ncbi:hypothetical protein HanPI659440_Chr08g0313781 [Helianthus annuus]|nr:hypothetical protein HanPI659440_Chr08g0313781 [Helianthus annuus]